MPVKKIEFTEEKVKGYLDDCIRYWRKERDGRGEGAVIAVYYIDAFQSVRTSLFGKLLPKTIVGGRDGS